MRKLTASLFITLDGVVEAPHTWNPPYYEERMAAAVNGRLAAGDTHLYGRRSYELFRAVFTGPKAAAIPHAPIINDTPKLLVSSTVSDAPWGPTRVLEGDLAGEISALKQGAGANIDVQASATLIRFLLSENLLEELQLFIHPLVLGRGQRLFTAASAKGTFELVEAETFPSGVLAVKFDPRGSSSARSAPRSTAVPTV